MIIEGEVYYELEGFEENNTINDWRCPKCDEIIATTEQQAIEFLSEKDLSHKEAIELGMKVEE